MNPLQGIGTFALPPAPAPHVDHPSSTAAKTDPPAILTTLRAQHVVEAALVVAQEPLSLADMSRLFDQAVGFDTLRSILHDLCARYATKGFELICLAEGWRLQCREEMTAHLNAGKPQKPARYSSAAMETLAVIAYRQPVTRADIEEVRGVGVSPQLLQQFLDRDWVEVIGHREAPGRPALYATTRKFLEDLGIDSLSELPEIASIQSGEPSEPADPIAPASSEPKQQEINFGSAVVGAEGDRPHGP